MNEVQHRQQFVDANNRKSVTAQQQYEMMCKAYRQERNGMYVSHHSDRMIYSTVKPEILALLNFGKI